MDQSERYYQYLERLTREMVSPEQIRVETVYEDLRELCKMLRVSKGVTAFYSSLSHERRGQGDVYIPYDNGSETDKALTSKEYWWASARSITQRVTSHGQRMSLSASILSNE